MQSAEHLDEGVIHAWLDGQLPTGEAAAVEAHTRECESCAALVAEARGYLAGASSILSALDAAPVVDRTAPVNDGVVPLAPRVDRAPARRRRVWVMPTAAAATLVVAIGTTLTMRSLDRGASLEMASTADSASPLVARESDAGAGAASAVPRGPTPAPVASRVAVQESTPLTGVGGAVGNVRGGIPVGVDSSPRPLAALTPAPGIVASRPVVIPSTRNEAVERRDVANAKATVAAEQTTVATTAPATPPPPAAADFSGRGVAGGVARGSAAPDSDRITAQRRSRDTTSAVRADRAAPSIPLRQDAAATGMSAQSAAGITPWLGCWQVDDPPAGYPARVRLDSAQLAAVRARGEVAYSVVAVEPSAAQVIGWWQPVGAPAASGRVVLLPPSIGSSAGAARASLAPAPAGDTVAVRRIGCPR